VKPIDMVLHCPNCGAQHIDREETITEYNERLADGFTSERWMNPAHRSHQCQKCMFVWRPADVCTNGVGDVSTQGLYDSEIDHDHLEREIDKLRRLERISERYFGQELT
jgi:hypothetical protein